jgi:hypothetical protein
MPGYGKKLSEIIRRTSLEEHGYDLMAIKEWRAREHHAGRPSGLDDFFRSHGLCVACRCHGVVLTGWDDSGESLWEVCPVCWGTGIPNGKA